MIDNLIFIDMTTVIITYSERLDKSRLLQYGKITNDLIQMNTLFLRLSAKDEKSEQIAEIGRIDGVARAEFNISRKAQNTLHAIPTDAMRMSNDPIYQELNLYSAWGITKGDPRIKIAVLDSGCDMQHPDINTQSGGVFISGVESTNKGYPIKVNFGDLLAQDIVNGSYFGGWVAFKLESAIFSRMTWASLSGLTPAVFYADSTCKTPLNIGNTYPTNTSDYTGEAWIKEPFCLYYLDDSSNYWLGAFGKTEMWDAWGHGTAICGLISAPHNGNGFAGIAPNCTTVAYKMVNDNYTVSTVDMIATVVKAADDGCHVLSCSFGGPAAAWPQSATDAFQYAYNKKCISVVASGNMGRHWNEDVDTDDLDYPSALSTCIGVGACGWTDYTVANTDGHMDMPTTKLDFARLSSFSQKFPQVDIVAPGYGWIFHAPTDYSLMWQWYPFNTNSRFYTYQGDGGTSFSCPATAAGIALCMSRYLSKYNINSPVIPTTTAPWGFNTVMGWLTSGAKLPVKLSNGNAATKGYGRGRFDIYKALVAV